jgi:hypothetical protein
MEFLLTRRIGEALTMCGYVHKKPNARTRFYHVYLRDNTSATERVLTVDLSRPENDITKFHSKRSRDFDALRSGFNRYYAEKPNETKPSDNDLLAIIVEFVTHLFNMSLQNAIEIRSNVLTADEDENEEERGLEELLEEFGDNPVNNNHFDELGTLETICYLKYDEETVTTQLSYIYLMYDRQKKRFNISGIPPFPLKNRPILDTPTFTKETLRDLLDEDKPDDFENNKMPTFLNKTAMRTAEFRALLWKGVRDTVRRFVYLRDDFYDLITAYVVLTYFFDIFDFVPYLALWGAHGTGKTQLGSVISRLAYRSMSIVGGSTAFIYRAINSVHGTYTAEETQSIFDDKDKTEQRDIIKAGTQKYAKVGKIGGARNEKTDLFSIFSPKIFQSTSSPDIVILDRSIPFIMQRAPSNMNFESPDTIIPQANKLREYLLVQRLLNAYELEDFLKKNKLKFGEVFKNREKDHAKAILGVTKFFSPDVFTIVEKSLALSLSKREDIGEDKDKMLMDHLVLYGYTLDDWIPISELTTNINKYYFGVDKIATQKSAKEGYENIGLGRILSKLEFNSRRASFGMEYYISKKNLIKAYASKGFDLSDILSRETCLKFVDADILDQCKPSGLAGKTPEQLKESAKGVILSVEDLDDYYSEDELDYIQEQKESDSMNGFFFDEAGLTEDELDYITSEERKKQIAALEKASE